MSPKVPCLFVLLVGAGALCAVAQVPAPSTAAAETPVAPAVAAAEASIAKSDWKGAEGKLAAWIAEHPGDGRALFDAGYVADVQNQLEPAADFYRRAITANPKSFEAHLSLGLLLARQGKTEDARPQLLTATQLDPGEVDPAVKAKAWRALARIDQASDPSAASSELLQALKLTSETSSDTLLAAEIAEHAGEWDAAEAAYRRLLSKDPHSEPGNVGLGHVLIAQKKYADAEEFLRSALKQSPDDPTLTAQLATVLAAQDKAEAIPLLQKLYEAHPEDDAIARMLAEVLAESGDAAGSDQIYTKLLSSHPDDGDLLIAHGQNLIRQQKFSEAFGVFDKATRLAPSNGDGWSGLAFAASKTGQPSVTVHALMMRSKYLPETPSSYFLWATSYDMLHDRVAAIRYYHQFLEAAAGKFPDQEWQARQRLLLLEKK